MNYLLYALIINECPKYVNTLQQLISKSGDVELLSVFICLITFCMNVADHSPSKGLFNKGGRRIGCLDP